MKAGGVIDAEGIEAMIERDGYELRSSAPLNLLGYQLLGDGEVNMAIAVFEVNVSHFPEDPNCYDSLAEAYLLKGDRERAIMLYKQAIEVDPSFENSRRMLEQLGAGE
jgi:tetratricopeptide (TPR) repeat protein